MSHARHPCFLDSYAFILLQTFVRAEGCNPLCLAQLQLEGQSAAPTTVACRATLAGRHGGCSQGCRAATCMGKAVAWLSRRLTCQR